MANNDALAKVREQGIPYYVIVKGGRDHFSIADSLIKRDIFGFVIGAPNFPLASLGDGNQYVVNNCYIILHHMLIVVVKQ